MRRRSPDHCRGSIPAEEIVRKQPAFRDECLAPEVDRELLLGLVRRELSEEEAREVYRLIYSFMSWHEAHAEMLVEEFRRTHGSAP